MRILMDADACPVVTLVEKTSKKYSVDVTLYCDTNYILISEIPLQRNTPGLSGVFWV